MIPDFRYLVLYWMAAFVLLFKVKVRQNHSGVPEKILNYVFILIIFNRDAGQFVANLLFFNFKRFSSKKSQEKLILTVLWTCKNYIILIIERFKNVYRPTDTVHKLKFWRSIVFSNEQYRMRTIKSLFRWYLIEINNSNLKYTENREYNSNNNNNNTILIIIHFNWHINKKFILVSD